MRRDFAVLATAWLVLAATAPTPGTAQDGGPEEPEFQRLIYAEVWLGNGWPIGSANVDFDPSVGAGGRIEMEVKPMLRGGLELAFHSFDAELPAIRDNQGVLALSLFGKLNGVLGPYRPFGLFGLGVVNSKRDDATRRWDPALQIGGGVEAPISDHVAVLVGSALHTVPRGEEETDLLWISAYLGFVFQQP